MRLAQPKGWWDKTTGTEIALSASKELVFKKDFGGPGGDGLTNVQCKAIWNCHNVQQIHPNKNREKIYTHQHS
jgi:hypothetical protein